MSGYTIIDADTHVTETPDLWTSRAPASMRDRVPRVEKNDDGSLGWVIAGDSMLTNPGLTATAGVGTTADPPKSYEEMHPGAYDAKARLAYMDQLGIWAMVMYPNVGGFGAQQFLKMNDPELMLRCLQIYNDWQSEWAEADSRRLLPITSLPFWMWRRRWPRCGAAPRWGTAASCLAAHPRPSGSPCWATRSGTRSGRPRSS